MNVKELKEVLSKLDSSFDLLDVHVDQHTAGEEYRYPLVDEVEVRNIKFYDSQDESEALVSFEDVLVITTFGG